MSNLSDNELIESFLAGNQVHAKLLYERHKMYIARVIMNMVGNKPHAVENLMQETFVKVFSGLKSFEGKAAFKTWAVKIAINTVINYRKKQARRNKYPKVSIDTPEETDGPVFELADKYRDPLNDLINREIITVFEAAMDMLSDKHKEVIVLWNEGFSYNEIAEITNTSVKTVGSRLHYAKDQLKNILTPYLKENKKGDIKGQGDLYKTKKQK